MLVCPPGLQGRANRTDATVHHVRRRDDVAAGLDLHQRLGDQDFERFVIEDLRARHQSVMAVAGIGIERHIAPNPDVGHLGLDRTGRLANQVFRVERFCRILAAQLRIGIGKQRNDRNAELSGLSRRLNGQIDGQPVDARHGRHGRAAVGAVGQKYWPDEVRSAQGVFLHHAARPVSPAVAPHPGGRKARRRHLRCGALCAGPIGLEKALRLQF